jgi:hypothetical protein
MKLSAVLLARTIFFVESAELNPRGAAYYPDIITKLVERYQFKNYPTKFEDFNETKGIVLAAGKHGDKTIQAVTIYNWGISLDTTSSTKDSESLLIEALTWAAENIKLHFSPDMIKRKAYVSHLLVQSDAPILALNPFFDSVSSQINKELASSVRLPYHFVPRGISFGLDPEEQRIPVQVFSIERRDGVAYSEGKYFATAPVPTDVHFSILEQFERAAHNQTERSR